MMVENKCSNGSHIYACHIGDTSKEQWK